jgi:hypothetical protein
MQGEGDGIGLIIHQYGWKSGLPYNFSWNFPIKEFQPL